MAVQDVKLWFAQEPVCPLKKLPTRLEAVAARAWPAGAEAISGCCDPP